MLLVLVIRHHQRQADMRAVAAVPLGATCPGSNQKAMLQKAKLEKSSPSLEDSLQQQLHLQQTLWH